MTDYDKPYAAYDLIGRMYMTTKREQYNNWLRNAYPGTWGTLSIDEWDRLGNFNQMQMPWSKVEEMRSK